jgi:glycosyltransferase involved in cell wall biosynthesis
MQSIPLESVVSAIIPAHNADRYLADAIDSALAQTYPGIECIVVDDGSTDRTSIIASAYGERIRVIRQEQHGVSAARNRGAAEARGGLLAFLDADDRWLPERIERQVRELNTGDGTEAAVCATRVVDASLNTLGVIRQNPRVTVRDLLLCRANLVSVSSNLLVTRRAFDEIGGFDERLSTSADWKFMYQLVTRGRLAVLPDSLVEYRLHDTNMSSNVERFGSDMFRAFGQIFDPARRQPGVASLERRAYANLHRMLAGSYFVDGSIGPFLRHAWSAVCTHPSVLTYFLALPARRLRRTARRLRKWAT